MTDDPDPVVDVLSDVPAAIRTWRKGDERDMELILGVAEHWNVAKAAIILLTEFIDIRLDAADELDAYLDQLQADLFRKRLKEGGGDADS